MSAHGTGHGRFIPPRSDLVAWSWPRDAPFIVDRTADAPAPEEARSARCFVSVSGAAGGPRTQTSHIPKLSTHDA
jgi:hypothetical protein